MTWRAIIWPAKCLGLCILGIFVCGQVTTYSTPLLWWVLHRASATYMNRWAFQFQYFFQLRAMYGLLLGLVPIGFCVEAFRSMNGLFHSQGHMDRRSEFDWRRPILWAWAPLALVFLVRFATWQAPDQSVLSAPDHFERFRYFFDPMSLAKLNPLALQATGLVFDVVIINGPMIFMLAYTTGVWLRHQRPGLEHTLEPVLVESAEQPTNPH
jgi:hypothetical protein